MTKIKLIPYVLLPSFQKTNFKVVNFCFLISGGVIMYKINFCSLI